MSEQDQRKSVSNRLYDVHVEPRSFVPDGQSRPVDYMVVIFQVKISGSEEEIVTKISSDKAKLLLASEVLPDDLLDALEETPAKK